MSWKVCNLMSAKQEFVRDRERSGLRFAELCRRHGISRKTGYKWLKRYQIDGSQGLSERSRKPHSSPKRSSEEVERRVVEIRGRHPCWGGRKIAQVLSNEGFSGPIPAPSTVTGILRRHGLLGGGTRQGSANFQRFERSAPNDLWQMDFKGHFAMAGTRRCHPLTILDDHSRYNILLKACGQESREVVQPLLIEAFRRYGLPRQILCDNGGPWGTAPGETKPGTILTGLVVWLLRIGVEVIHGRPRHPQTQGKEERFHRTLRAEVLLRTSVWQDLSHCQREFDRWSHIYNEHRPHESLGLACPGQRYQLSARAYPETLPPVTSYYVAEDQLREVRSRGEITLNGRTYAIGQALAGQTIALRPVGSDNYDVYYCWKKLGTIDPTQATKPKGYPNPLKKPEVTE